LRPAGNGRTLSSTPREACPRGCRVPVDHGGFRHDRNHAVPLVQRQGRRGGRLLRLDLPPFEDHQGGALPCGKPGPDGPGDDLAFELDGCEFIALNGGPHFPLTPAFSLVVKCENQAEVDRYWAALSADPASEQCGWLKDKFGLSWQIVPNVMPELVTDKDPEKAERAMQAMLRMKKIDIEELKRAHAGATVTT
jgi:predicted 3-demethylubiquinone-9 3-methyltransferase (glyoxalase superfamily)